MTIIELSLTISVLLMMAGIAIYSVGGYHEWRLGREAATSLRSVYLAQKFFLADHPTFQIADVTGSDLIPYLPGNASGIPTVEALDGSTKSVDFHVMPPVVAGNYDPSGTTDDGIWDVGKR
jgi:hypothetical protein